METPSGTRSSNRLFSNFSTYNWQQIGRMRQWKPNTMDLRGFIVDNVGSKHWWIQDLLGGGGGGGGRNQVVDVSRWLNVPEMFETAPGHSADLSSLTISS